MAYYSKYDDRIYGGYSSYKSDQIQNKYAAKYANYYAYDQGTATTANGQSWVQVQSYVVQTGSITATNTVAWAWPQDAYAAAMNSVTVQTYCSGTVTVPAPETEEQRLEREQRERDAAAKEAARRKRAKDALLSVLTEAQRQQLETEKCFELQVNERLYRVRPGSRVERLDPQSKQIESYFCIHPELRHNLPSEDVALSQKLLLETNEKEFLRIANETKAEDRSRAAVLNEVIDALNRDDAVVSLELAA